ncbi:MAG: transporter [Burkholderiales bacterium]|nr:transporter [Burkholderiales bacterium]
MPARAQTADAGPAVTPYRPSVSTPATLSAPGYLEFEAGGLLARGGGDSRRSSLPYTVKLAFSPDWGLRLGGEAWARQAGNGAPALQGLGDTGVVLKRRFAVDAASAFGLELGATAPTGRTGLGAKAAAGSLNGIYSADLGALHTDINLVATRYAHADPGVARDQALWAAALSGPLTPRLGLTAELSGTRQRGADATTQLLLAASYSVWRALVLDAGLARSLRRGVPDAALFFGLTVLGPRLF